MKLSPSPWSPFLTAQEDSPLTCLKIKTIACPLTHGDKPSFNFKCKEASHLHNHLRLIHYYYYYLQTNMLNLGNHQPSRPRLKKVHVPVTLKFVTPISNFVPMCVCVCLASF